MRYYKDKGDEAKPRVDETKISRREIETEKVTVTRTDRTRTEEIERPRYPRDQDFGRIVIEELPEGKTEKPRDMYRKFMEKPRTTELSLVRQDVRDISKLREKEDVMRVGKLDVCQLEERPVESRKKEERLLRTEKLEEPRKVC